MPRLGNNLRPRRKAWDIAYVLKGISSRHSQRGPPHSDGAFDEMVNYLERRIRRIQKAAYRVGLADARTAGQE